METGTSQRGHRKTRTGVVVSDKMEKTCVVEITRRVKHPVYQKYIKRSKRYHVHDETNECRVGDRIQIVETRPVSATKRWRLKNVIEKAPVFE